MPVKSSLSSTGSLKSSGTTKQPRSIPIIEPKNNIDRVNIVLFPKLAWNPK